MLTRRQQWRRASVKKPEPLIAGTPPCSPVNSTENIEHLRGGDVESPTRASPSRPTPERKGVRFSKDVFVVLIPTRHELRACNLTLSWTFEEIASFQEEAIRDIRLFAELKGISLTDARRELYQPHPDDLCCSSEDIALKLRRDSVLKLLPQDDYVPDVSQNFFVKAPKRLPVSPTFQDETAIETRFLAAPVRQWAVPPKPVCQPCQ